MDGISAFIRDYGASLVILRGARLTQEGANAPPPPPKYTPVFLIRWQKKKDIEYLNKQIIFVETNMGYLKWYIHLCYL